jgi:tetratricopeptide (TPR) repeat protein
MTGGAVLSAQEMDTPAIEQRLSASAVAQEQSFRKTIVGIESSQGAYASALSEQLLSLGLALQSQGQHDEAVGLFKRGVHLARINDGLYSTQQIPLLQGQIASHIALGDYAQADERQHYMYRVQIRNKDNGEPLTKALMQQANWQRSAYFLGIGVQGYIRIMNMWDMYRLALNEIIAREGDTSPKLLLPLHGMLEAQYLISEYDWEGQSHSSSDDLGARQELNRFMAYRAQSYQKGSAVITAIHDIELEREGAQSVATAQALTMLGDWQLWHDKRDTAWQTYQEAMVELAERDDAQVQIDHLFGEPVALPDVSGVRPLPPTVDTAEADILLEFGVTERGRVVNVERVDEDESDSRNPKAYRLMRKLRKTRFRPRFEAGQPIETEKIVRAFNIE